MSGLCCTTQYDTATRNRPDTRSSLLDEVLKRNAVHISHLRNESISNIMHRIDCVVNVKNDMSVCLLKYRPVRLPESKFHTNAQSPKRHLPRGVLSLYHDHLNISESLILALFLFLRRAAPAPRNPRATPSRLGSRSLHILLRTALSLDLLKVCLATALAQAALSTGRRRRPVIR